jgi:type VI secretion system secreted protein VgrG
MATPPVMRLSTALGADKLRFRRMSAAEEVSRSFEFSIQALSEDGTLAASSLLGKPASVAVQLPDGSDRCFHGLVCAMGLEGSDEALYSYRLLLRPWLWLLTRRADTRVFQNKSLQDVLKAVFEPFSVDYRFDLNGSYPTYEYCVQYRESDFDFVSRLLEQEGIYYYFEHEQSRHTLVLCDRSSAHKPCPGQSEIPFRETLDGLIDLEAVTDWRVVEEIQSGQAVLTDYDFEHPQTSLQATAKASRSTASSKLEVYDPPGRYLTKDAGDRYAKLRVEGEQARYTRVTGKGAVRSLAAGHSFTLKEHPRADQNTKYILLSTRIEAQYAGYASGGGDTSYTCQFVALPATEQYRPEAVTPKPMVHGPQTALVVGPSGEEIHTDKYGRVKVQFHWDRLGKKDENSSCWVRVSHPWAGKGWGMLALPRIGQEVVVSFLDGDPDRPLITGRVYNADNMPPYTLPDHATISTIKSRSSKGGGDSDYNELRFEDKKGSEYVLLQAQKDFYTFVKADARSSIGNDEFRIVTRNFEQVIKGEAKYKVEKDVTEVFGAKHNTTIGDQASITIGAKHNVTVGADQNTDVGGNWSLNAATNGDAKFGANLGVEAGANVHIKAGANLVIEAGAMITLKAGGSSIVIGPTVSITGSMVMINSGGAAGAGQGAKPSKPDKAEKFDPAEEKQDPIGG